MHSEAREYVAQALRTIGGAAGRSVLEIGSLNVNGGTRELCADAALYWGIDKAEGPGVDQATDAHTFVPTSRFDLVLCTEVLEHDPEPAGIIAAAARALIPGGYLVLTCASSGRKPHNAYGAEHPEHGEHYANINPSDLEAYLDGWDILDLDYLYPPGDARVLARWNGGT